MARVVLLTVLALCILIASAAGYAAYSYDRGMRIDTPHGIREAGYIRIGGIDQWLQIRGQDRRNPVLLWLNGGPGYSTIPDTYVMTPWERQLTIVMWDQRGEGRTFERSGTTVAPTMSIAQMTQDGIEVALYLRQHLQQSKIILLGHSWGSILGVHMIKARPDLFAVYVGTGQVTHLEQQAEAAYPLLIERARSLGNQEALRELTAAGPPPYPPQDPHRWAWVKWANRLDPARETGPAWLSASAHGLSTAAALWNAARQTLSRSDAGADFSQGLMWTSIMAENLPALGLHFDVPIVLIQGTDDRLTVTALVKDYFDHIDAPSKQLVLLPGAGHLGLFRDRERFFDALIAHARPLALAGASTSQPLRT